MRLLRGVLASVLAVVAVAPAASAQEPIRTLDVRRWYNFGYGSDTSPAMVGTRRTIVDTIAAAVSLQGLVNRDAPRLYLYFSQLATPPSTAIDSDTRWLARMQGDDGAGVLAGRALEPVADIDAALEAYRPYVRGLAVWDERVPATLNAAFTAAGAEDLVVVRWDADPTSLFQRLLARGYPVVESLVASDGASRLHDHGGAAPVADTTHPTSQSAKDDAYLWALERFLRPGRLDPTEFGETLDGAWVDHPLGYNDAAHHGPLVHAPFNITQLTSHDWQVARRGFAYDLGMWTDRAPDDDPGQPVGNDVRVLREVLAEARHLAGDRVISVRGFPAWPFKYNQGTNTTDTEFLGTQIISAYGAGLDADAWFPSPVFSNASFYAHVPLDEVPEPQRRPTPEDLVGQGFLAGLADNGGFEDGDDGWVMHATGHQVYTDSTQSHGGVRLVQIRSEAPGDAAQNTVYRDGPGVAAGATVVLRAFVRATSGAVDGELVLWAGAGAAQQHASTAFTAGAAWTEVRTTLLVRAAAGMATRGQIVLHTASRNLDLDDVAFYAGDAATARVVPATYGVWFVGDWDSAAGMYSMSPASWDADGRGRVPLAWDFSGHVLPRMPLFARHVLATRTPRDFFISADSGPGYGNPSQMDAPTRALWGQQGVRDARRLDESIGWVFNPLAPLDATHLGAATPYDPDGIFIQQHDAPTSVGDVPLVFVDNMTTDFVASVHYWSPPDASVPTFWAHRAAFQPPSQYVAATTALVADETTRAMRYRFVDPFTLMYLARHARGGGNDDRASFRAVHAPPVVTAGGGAVHLEFSVRNDGWNTWRAAGANPFRAGANVSATPPDWRALPPTPGAYPARAPLPRDVPPGDEVALSLEVPSPAAPGDYTVQLDMVEDGRAWFEMLGDIPAQFTLHVTAPGAAMVDGGAAVVDGGANHAADAGDAGDASDAPARSDGCGCRAQGEMRGAGRGGLAMVIAAGLARRRVRRTPRSSSMA